MGKYGEILNKFTIFCDTLNLNNQYTTEHEKKKKNLMRVDVIM